MLTYSVVICTLDRPEDLKRCIGSWLKQEEKPLDIVVVHGRRDGLLKGELQKLLTGSGVELCYLRMPPSLVRQRNAGIQQAKGNIVFFADDDAVYLAGYARAILEVYQDDPHGLIGGVQGTIDNFDLGLAEKCGFSRFFLLPCFGNGSLQPSAWPSFCQPANSLAQVEIFSGAAMSYRKEVLREFQFNETFARYWVGDDFEMSYRVSRKYKLIQVAGARLMHYMSAASRDSERRKCKMVVVNHYLLMHKIFGASWKSWLFWFWAELGLWIIAFLCLLTGRGFARLLGMADGYRELWGMRR